jgi:spore germination protein YaaH
MKRSSISRRSFLYKAATVGVAGAVVPSMITCCARETKVDTGTKAKMRMLSPWFIYKDETSIETLRPNSNLISSISAVGVPTPEFIRQCHEMGIKAYLLVGGNDGKVFATPSARKELIQSYLNRCQDIGADGIDLDFESLDSEYRTGYSTLLSETAQALHAASKELSMCVSYVMCTWRSNSNPVAVTETQIDGGWYDPALIGKTCDVVRVMCYDMISPSSKAVGPVSTTPWARDAMRFWLQHVPKEHLVMGLPAYSRDFSMTGKGETLSSYTPAPDLSAGYQMQALWLPYEAIHQYRYSTADGTEHVFFASDAASTRAHLQTAVELGIQNIGFWHYGAVIPETWQAVRQWINYGK